MTVADYITDLQKLDPTLELIIFDGVENSEPSGPVRLTMCEVTPGAWEHCECEPGKPQRDFVVLQ